MVEQETSWVQTQSDSYCYDMCSAMKDLKCLYEILRISM